MFSLQTAVHDRYMVRKNAEIFNVKDVVHYSSQNRNKNSKMVSQHDFINKILLPASAFYIY